MNGKRCFLMGNWNVPAEIRPHLEQAIRQHITQYGVTEFLVGGYGEFDRMAASVLAEVKADFPGITLSLLLPYHPAVRQAELPAGFDGSWYPDGMEGIPLRFAISRASRLAIVSAGYLIACCLCPDCIAWTGASAQKREEWGMLVCCLYPCCTARIVEYAQKREEWGLITVTMVRGNSGDFYRMVFL